MNSRNNLVAAILYWTYQYCLSFSIIRTDLIGLIIRFVCLKRIHKKSFVRRRRRDNTNKLKSFFCTYLIVLVVSGYNYQLRQVIIIGDIPKVFTTRNGYGHFVTVLESRVLNKLGVCTEDSMQRDRRVLRKLMTSFGLQESPQKQRLSRYVIEYVHLPPA